FAYDPRFGGGVFVGAGDVNNDFRADIVTGAGPGGGPHVKVFDGRNGLLMEQFFASAANFPGGVRVAAGDVTGDGKADIATGAGRPGDLAVRARPGATEPGPVRPRLPGRRVRRLAVLSTQY